MRVKNNQKTHTDDETSCKEINSAVKTYWVGTLLYVFFYTLAQEKRTWGLLKACLTVDGLFDFCWYRYNFGSYFKKTVTDILFASNDLHQLRHKHQHRNISHFHLLKQFAVLVLASEALILQFLVALFKLYGDKNVHIHIFLKDTVTLKIHL